MIEKILYYYKKELTNRNLVFKFMPWTSGAFILLYLLIFTSIILFIFSRNPLLLFLSVPGIIMFFKFNKKAKAVLVERYNIISEEFLWGGEEFQRYRINLLKDFLDKEGLLNKDAISFLLEIFNSKLDDTKPTPFIRLGTFLALFTPAWSAFISWSYNHGQGSFKDAFGLFLTLILFATSIAVLFASLELLQTEVKDNKIISEHLNDIF